MTSNVDAKLFMFDVLCYDLSRKLKIYLEWGACYKTGKGNLVALLK